METLTSLLKQVWLPVLEIKDEFVCLFTLVRQCPVAMAFGFAAQMTENLVIICVMVTSTVTLTM